MAIRLARPADAALLKRLFEEFQQQVGVEITPSDLERIRSHQGDAIRLVDDEAGFYCALRPRPLREEVEVAALFPRGASRGRLKLLLVDGCRRILAGHPEAGTWRVWAEFPFAVDERGRRDGGRSEALAWKAVWPAVNVRLDGSHWVGEVPLAVIAAG